MLKLVVVILALVVLAAPFATEAEQAGKVVRIGAMTGASPRSAPRWVAFDQRLREMGYADGDNIAIDFKNAEGEVDRSSEIVELE